MSQRARLGRYPATPWATARLYRPFLIAAIIFGLVGTMLGAVMMAGWLPPAAALEAHASLQLLGWCGLFIFGMTMHIVPRFYGNAPIWFPWPQRVTLVLIAGGLLLRGVAGANPGGAPSPVAVAAGGMAVAVGLSVAGTTLGRVMWARTMPTRSIGRWLWLGLGGVGITAITLAVMSLQQGLSGADAPDPRLWRTFESAALYLFILPFAFGIASRSASALLGLRASDATADCGALVLVGTGGVALVLGAAADLPIVSGVGMLGIAGGSLAHIVAIRIFEPTEHTSHLWFLTYLRTAYAWLGVALTLYAWKAFGSFGAAGAVALPGRPELHALTVGYISILIIGVASRMLPLFEGRPLSCEWLLRIALVLLTFGTTVRIAAAVVVLPPCSLHLAGAMAAAGMVLGVVPIAHLLVRRRSGLESASA